jgi:Ribonuclease G/E
LFGARVRGIYSTALTKLLIDNGFEIVQPSARIKERFNLEGVQKPLDLVITDRRNRQGVYVRGRAEPVDIFCSVLRSHLDDVIIRRLTFTLGGIYKGLVEQKETITKTLLVNIGPVTGKLSMNEVTDVNAGQVVVQVRRALGRGGLLLSTNLTLPGRYVVLTSKPVVKVSKRLLDFGERSRLLKLGERLAPKGWGLLWRRSAANQPEEVLQEEVSALLKNGEALLKRAEKAEAPALLQEGFHLTNVEFPSLSKTKLDKVRGEVTPTLRGHHLYKAWGGKVSAAVDMAERLLKKGCSHSDVKELFEQTVEREYPTVGSLIEIEHVKLDGNVFRLGKALVQNVEYKGSNVSFLRVRRDFRVKGIYDGLKVSKEPGDYAVTQLGIEKWHTKTQYFSKNGRLKGIYVNLNTPVEIYSYGVRYVDLEVDVCMWPDGRVEVLDEGKLEKALAEGLVGERLVEIVREKAKEIVKHLKESHEVQGEKA